MHFVLKLVPRQIRLMGNAMEVLETLLRHNTEVYA